MPYIYFFVYRCSYENCQFETKYPKSLKSHVKDQHTGGTTKRTHRSEDSKSIVHCVECGKTYKKWYYQQVHISTCGNQSTLSCEICHQVCIAFYDMYFQKSFHYNISIHKLPFCQNTCKG